MHSDDAHTEHTHQAHNQDDRTNTATDSRNTDIDNPTEARHEQLYVYIVIIQSPMRCDYLHTPKTRKGNDRTQEAQVQRKPTTGSLQAVLCLHNHNDMCVITVHRDTQTIALFYCTLLHMILFSFILSYMGWCFMMLWVVHMYVYLFLSFHIWSYLNSSYMNLS